jgi:deazaflavin-dependent oxidoreductase (nitroreductase family)
MLTRVDTGPWRYFYRAINPMMRLMIHRFGVGGKGNDLLRTLRVRGRTSGRSYDVPVRVAVMDDERYIVAMFATAQWVKNLRARGEAELVLGKSVEPVKTHELEGEERRAVVKAYAEDPHNAGRVKFGLRADPSELTPEELQRGMAPFAFFRLESVRPTATG